MTIKMMMRLKINKARVKKNNSSLSERSKKNDKKGEFK
jgi:hypothetical protein